MPCRRGEAFCFLRGEAFLLLRERCLDTLEEKGSGVRV
jgi:hypothetical protein